MKTFRLTFADGYKITILAHFDEMLSMLDSFVQAHGDCAECLEKIKFDRNTGAEYKKIW